MKITAIARAQSVYAMPPSIFATVPVFDLVDGLKARYGFRHIPTGQELINPPPNQPTNFLWGKCHIGGRTITVESLQVQNYAALATSVSVTTRTSTDDSDLVLADLQQWVVADFKVNAKQVFPANYVSQLEFIVDRPISEQLMILKPLAELVTGLVRGYGFTACPDYEPSSFILFFDNSKFTNPPTFAGSFLVDRRAGAGYEENRYYSQAPLRTADHIALLNELEKLLMKK